MSVMKMLGLLVIDRIYHDRHVLQLISPYPQLHGAHALGIEPLAAPYPAPPSTCYLRQAVEIQKPSSLDRLAVSVEAFQSALEELFLVSAELVEPASPKGSRAT